MINRVVFGGRLTKDPELRYTPNGVPVCSFTLASDRNFKNSNGERETDFMPVVVYRQLAEACANSLAKGKQATVDGRIQVRSYNDANGQRKWVYEIIAEIVQFPPKESSNYQSGYDDSQSHGDSSNQNGGQGWGNEYYNDDDIPFI